MDWLDLLAVQGTLKSLLQHWCSLLRQSMTQSDTWLSSRMCTHFLLQELKITTCCWTAIDRRMLDPTRKRYISKGKGKAPEDGKRGEIMFRNKPHNCQRRSERSNKPCAHQDPETPQRLSQNCVWVLLEEVRVSSALLQGRGSGYSRPGYGISPLRGGYH